MVSSAYLRLLIFLLAILIPAWTVAHQAPPSVGFSRLEHWTGLPFPSPGDLPDPGIEPGSPTLQADALLSEPRRRVQIPVISPFMFDLRWTCCRGAPEGGA